MVLRDRAEQADFFFHVRSCALFASRALRRDERVGLRSRGISLRICGTANPGCALCPCSGEFTSPSFLPILAATLPPLCRVAPGFSPPSSLLPILREGTTLVVP
jgi:hypothetical protein